jgi:Tfp pilus assembly protein PilV
VSAHPASSARRDGLFAGCLALVLGFGVLGVLLLNTSMQQQAQAMARSHERLAALTEQVQRLRTELDWASDPAALAARARELRLRPAKRIDFVRVSGRTPAAGRARAG